MQLRVLSAGAAQAVVSGLAPEFEARSGYDLAATFGAVGFQRDAFLAGQPCDVLILADAQISELEAAGRLLPGSSRAIGGVATGIATREGESTGPIRDGGELRSVLERATAIFVPDLEHSTAGRHFAGVLERLGLSKTVLPRVRAYPNGATAMSELAKASGERPIGCTQATEILQTAGVVFVCELPPGFELSTVYTAAVSSRSEHPEAAAAFTAALTGERSLPLRRRAGFRV